MTLDEFLALPPLEGRAYVKANPEEGRRLLREMKERFKRKRKARGRSRRRAKQNNVIYMEEWKKWRNR